MGQGGECGLLSLEKKCAKMNKNAHKKNTQKYSKFKNLREKQNHKKYRNRPKKIQKLSKPQKKDVPKRKKCAKKRGKMHKKNAQKWESVQKMRILRGKKNKKIQKKRNEPPPPGLGEPPGVRRNHHPPTQTPLPPEGPKLNKSLIHIIFGVANQSHLAGQIESPKRPHSGCHCLRILWLLARLRAFGSDVRV